MLRSKRRIGNILKISICIFFTLMYNCTALAAYMTDVPVTVVQPDGEELELYAGGDEYFNYLYDGNGSIIVKNYDTGYYVYAEVEGGKVVAGDVAVTNNFNFGEGGALPAPVPTINLEDIPEQYIKDVYEASPLNNTPSAPLRANSANNDRKSHPYLNETVNNIVIFIDFPDLKFNTALDTQYFDGIMNNNEDSLKSWFDTISYGKASFVSHLYPISDGTLLATYTDIYPYTVYWPHHKDSNGSFVYELNGENILRYRLEQNMLERAIEAVKNQISEQLDLDCDGDGCVDSITFIIAGGSKQQSENDLLWPHKWTMVNNVSINGKKVSEYSLITERYVKPNYSGNSTLYHESFHLYGAPDLYHYNRSKDVVNDWDIMDNTNGQLSCMYLRYKYGNWIDFIPEIKDDSGVYSINKSTLPTDNCYLIRSPYSTNEFFVVEYRKKRRNF